ncbi:MAG: hypothetical protein MMC33_006164 [Icmadophila ericetorum]|nr:hypothetical protein [Icmadophila ericetorum]
MASNPYRSAMSSPEASTEDAFNQQESQDVSVRPMKLKVLYTFDEYNKTNCLARWPHVVPVRTAYLDETTQIGVIALKTCIQAIVSASPELVAKLGQDYTVYAYDYSEYETPLVGQGMLSWVLASSSSTPEAPAHQSKTIVTGRVSKNILGLFSCDAQETLEVKLRLVPVPTCLQSEYIESMRKYRDISKNVPQGFDPQQWTKFVQANPGILSQVSRASSPSPSISAAPKDVGIEHVQRLMRDGSTSQETTIRDRPQSQGTQINNGGDQASMRVPSPAASVRSIPGQHVFQLDNGRPISQASNRNKKHPMPSSRRGSVDLGYGSGEERQEGPARKRAKVTKADWPSAGGFGQQPESLRVAASTAASIRVFQPTAVRPSNNMANSLEGPPRVPTPVPKPGERILRPLLPAARSSVGRESFSMSDLGYDTAYDSPYKSGQQSTPAENFIDEIASNNATDATTPADIGSSPPMPRSISRAPSSPVLPAMPFEFDSGFMSGSIDDLFEDEENRPLGNFDLSTNVQFGSHLELPIPPIGKPGVSTQTAKDTTVEPSRKSSFSAAPAKLHTPIPCQTQNRKRTTSSAGVGLPAAIASDPVKPARSSLHRSQTWSGRQATHPASDIPMGSEGLIAPRKPNARLGSGAKRKKQIQERLMTTIASGGMPPFCDNCGAIETPTWRKAWSKIHSGSSESVVLSKSEGAIVAMEILEKDDAGATTLFKIFKKSLLPLDVGFTEILLCNPCGLWLGNRQCMRPRNLWKETKDRFDKNKPADQSKKKKTGGTSQQPGNNNSTRMELASEESSPSEAADDERGDDEEEEQRLPPMKRQRAMSVQMANFQHSKSEGMSHIQAAAALQRAIQSSPGQASGTKHAPINLDDITPKPIRRILFPSPNQNNKPGTTTPLIERDIQASPKSASSTPGRSVKLRSSPLRNETNQENISPEMEIDDFNELFEDIQHPNSCPPTPTPRSQPRADLFKTPTKTPSPPKALINSGDFFSSSARAFLHAPVTPKCTPSRTSPLPPLSQSRPEGEATPFTSYINQYLSENPALNDSPSKFFDFSTLPSLSLDTATSSSPSRFLSANFSLYNFASTDAPMPSSPPMWFGVWDDGMGRRLSTDSAEDENGNDDEVWNALEKLKSSPLKKTSPSKLNAQMALGQSAAKRTGNSSKSGHAVERTEPSIKTEAGEA